MFDDSLRLREQPDLLSLLSHYAQLGSEDRVTWRDRVMQMAGVEPRQLSVLHGELIACDWIEQNTGQAIARPDGIIASCYRITLNGLREYRRIQGGEIEEDTAAPAKPQPRLGRKKKDNGAAPETLSIVVSEETPVVVA